MPPQTTYTLNIDPAAVPYVPYEEERHGGMRLLTLNVFGVSHHISLWRVDDPCPRFEDLYHVLQGQLAAVECWKPQTVQVNGMYFIVIVEPYDR